MKKKILVIEDTVKHLEDAKAFFASLADKVEVVYARDGVEAKYYQVDVDETGSCIPKPREGIDGIISDIYFPLNQKDSRFNTPEPIGVEVALIAKQIGIPCVLNTAGYHHGSKYEWINALARLQGWSLVDAHMDDSNPNKEADSKNWKWAYEKLERMIKK